VKGGFVIRPRHCTLLALISMLASLSAHALGTVAGTTIQNTAQVTYNVGTTTLSTSSNTTTITVAEILDVAVTLNTATVSVTPGATQQELVFTVTNTGNGTETFSLAGQSILAGDQFDPIPASPFIYFDTDSSGDFSAGDTPYVANTNDPVLLSTGAGSSVRVIVVNDIPSGVANGNRGRSQLSASARTGIGGPGTLYAGQGDGGVDAIVGTTGAAAQTFGEYLVEALQISAVKSQTVLDQFNGTRPLPGARITYQIVVTATGTGTATTVNFSDLIPANTTYVAGSLVLNSVALSDTTGNDAGEYTTTPTPRVLVSLGNLTAASGPQTIAFAVTIN
jgi:uncharacterized repeat protein (TIGR01451 family)